LRERERGSKKEVAWIDYQKKTLLFFFSPVVWLFFCVPEQMTNYISYSIDSNNLFLQYVD
jgi:hypothetical protein